MLLAAALALPAEAASGCDPNCEALWARFTGMSVTAMDTGSPVSASWRLQFDHERYDVRIDADYPAPGGRQRGTILLVGGRALLSRGLDLPRGMEVNAVDAPVMAMKLVIVVLAHAVPVAPETIGKERAIRLREEKVGLRFSTPTAAGVLLPPWTVEGKLGKAANGDIVYDLHVAGGTADGYARKGPPIDTRFTGRFSNVRTPILDDTMALASWTVYGTYDTEMRTIGDVRAATEHTVNRGAPDASKNFTGIWKQDCAQEAGLQIKPIGNDGMYSVSYCGPSGCWEPGTFRPNTFITGDAHYKVTSEMEMQIEEPKGFVTYQKCSSDPEPAQ